MFNTFNEYLDQKKKMPAPKKDQVADYTGKQETKPPMGEKLAYKNGEKPAHGGSDKKVPASDNKPYMAPAPGPTMNNKPWISDPKGGKAKNNGTPEKGFGDDGSKDLVYKPDTHELTNKEKEGGKKIGTWTKTQEWVEKTKGQSLAEFTQNIKSAPVQLVNQIVESAKGNKNVLNALVHECRNQNLLGALVSEMLKHEETYNALARLLRESESRRLVRAISEAVAPPMQKMDKNSDEDLPDGEPSEEPDNISGEDMPPGGDPDYDDAEDEDMPDEEGDDSDEMGDEMSPDMGDIEGGGGEGGGDMPHDDHPTMMPKKKHHPLVKAMQQSPMMGQGMGGM